LILVIASLSGAVGAVCRYLVSGWVQGRVDSDFPAGTLGVNLVGSLLLGLLAGGVTTDTNLGVAAVGLLGGFTTFSTWMVETLGLGARSPRAIVNLSVSLLGGVALAAIGFNLTS